MSARTVSSRVGSSRNSKAHKVIFYGAQANGNTCGHHHTSARAAKACIVNHKSRNPTDRVEWRIARSTPKERRDMAG